MRPAPFVALWPRGGAKSTSAELAAEMIGQRGIRRYLIYVSGTQDLADKHVATIATLFESAGMERLVNKYGASKGWRRNRLRTADGFTVDALGLDTAARGIKVDANRPDMIILDDIDARHDTALTIQKKIETLTTTVLPAGSNDCAVLAVQNLIHANGVFARLSDGRADFLADRIVSGPYPAVEGFEYEIIDGEAIITGGEATWAGQSLDDCQNFIRTWGLRAFLRECQHLVKESEGALWKMEWIDANRISDKPDAIRVVVAVDPSATSGTESAECGIIVVARDNRKHGYVLADYSVRTTPGQWGLEAVRAYQRWGADRIVGEVNNGGEMVENTIRTATDEQGRRIGEFVPYTAVRASRGKHTRAEPVSALYEYGKVHHVGVFATLENQMTTWIPGDSSPDRMDALVWGLTELDLIASVPEPGTIAKSNPSHPSRFIRTPITGSRWRRGDKTGYR